MKTKTYIITLTVNADERVDYKVIEDVAALRVEQLSTVEMPVTVVDTHVESVQTRITMTTMLNIKLTEDEAKATLMAVKARAFAEATAALDMNIKDTATTVFYQRLIEKLEAYVFPSALN